MNSLETELQGVRERLKDRLQELEQQLAPLQAELAKVRSQLEFIDKALKVDAAGTESKTAGVTTSSARSSINAIVEKILAEAVQPLHISEIRRRYLTAGHQIPGQGTESNLLIYMIRDPRFVRVSKGTYGLASAGLVPVQIQTKVRRRRKTGGRRRG